MLTLAPALVFFATGNVSPYNTLAPMAEKGRWPYACPVFAVHAATGKLAWYYQEVPDDRWHYDSDQKFIQTSLTLGGVKYYVVIHAAKSGYSYVFDRPSGNVLSATNFAFVSWTKELDPKTHRPRGEILYTRRCNRCHVFGRGVVPDLRRMSSAIHQIFDEIVLRGAYQPKGMARWDVVLSQADASAIHTFIIDQANVPTGPNKTW